MAPPSTGSIKVTAKSLYICQRQRLLSSSKVPLLWSYPSSTNNSLPMIRLAPENARPHVCRRLCPQVARKQSTCRSNTSSAQATTQKTPRSSLSLTALLPIQPLRAATSGSTRTTASSSCTSKRNTTPSLCKERQALPHRTNQEAAIQ